MDTFGRYYSSRDRNLVSQLNRELKNNIAQVMVTLFKIAMGATSVNIYGEAKASEGKSFYPGIDIYCWIERNDLDSEDEGFGLDRNQDLEFRFTEEDLINLNFYPESGDVIKFNERFYSIENVMNDKQLLGGQPDKNLSFIVKTHYTKLSSVNVVNRMV
jgi:hypothetical protein